MCKKCSCNNNSIVIPLNTLLKQRDAIKILVDTGYQSPLAIVKTEDLLLMINSEIESITISNLNQSTHGIN